MERMVEELRKEVDTLERRNIKFISTISEAQSREIQAMSDLYNMSTGRGLRSKQAGESGLPSLVDVTKCTSDQVSQYGLMLTLWRWLAEFTRQKKLYNIMYTCGMTRLILV